MIRRYLVAIHASSERITATEKRRRRRTHRIRYCD
jgi:hypothetical protein